MEKPKLYVLQHPTTLEIKYVGITMKTLKERLEKHLYDVINHSYKSPKKVKWFESLFEENKSPIITLIKEFETINECKQAEIDYIKKYKDVYNLVNNSIGGEYPEIVAINQYNIFGELVGEYESISQAGQHLGIKDPSHISSVCKKTRNSAYGYIWRYKNDVLGDISKINPKSIQFNNINQYDLKGNYIQTFENYKLAAEAVNDLSEGSNIASVCKGLQRQCKGFVWRLVPNFIILNEYLLEIQDSNIRENRTGKDGKKVEKYSLDGEYLETYNTICDASISVLGTINGRKQISNCCNDFNLSYKNFRWQYCPVEK